MLIAVAVRGIEAEPTLTFSEFPVHSSVLPILGRFILVLLPGVHAPGLVASTMIGNDRLGVFGCGVFKPTTSERLGLSYTDTVLEIRPNTCETQGRRGLNGKRDQAFR